MQSGEYTAVYSPGNVDFFACGVRQYHLLIRLAYAILDMGLVFCKLSEFGITMPILPLGGFRQHQTSFATA